MATTDDRTATHDGAFGWGDGRTKGRWLSRHPMAGWVVAVILFVGVIASVDIGSGSSSSSSPRKAIRPSGTPLVSTSVSGWTRVVAGVPVGYEETQAGATAAGANYLLARSSLQFAGSTLAYPMAEAMDTAARLATDKGYIGELLAAGVPARFGVDPQTGRVVPGSKVVDRPAILSVAVAQYTATSAQVVLWESGVLGVSTGVQPGASYNTETVSLVWERGDWKLANDTSTKGPTPGLSAGSAQTGNDSLYQQGGV